MRELLSRLPRPSHYAGSEINAVIKDPATVSLRVALAFPDMYEVGMSYLGQKILYEIINSKQEWWAERVMAPDPDAAKILLETSTPLATLESDTPISDFAAVCFSVTHELCCTDILHMLDLGHIPLRQANRSEDLRIDPLVIAGGGAMLGAEPLSPFFDLVALGDGEEVISEILSLLEQARKKNIGRSQFLAQARHIAGVYVPSLFREDEQGRLVPVHAGYRPRRRIISDLNLAPYPRKQVAPVGAVHDRLSLEIARGCSRGCRFCHAGMVYRPVRERTPEKINELLESCLEETGFDEVSFLALSAGDYTALKTIYLNSHSRCSQERITLALPSLRVGSVNDEIMGNMASARRPGATLAPEAGSQRLRDAINKCITEEDLLLHVRKLLEHGWRQVKLYFMIGLPTETDADLEAIANLCCKARDAAGPGSPKMQITAAISPFVPKPFTPFQWEAQPDLNEITRRINLLRNIFKKLKGIKLKWHDPSSSHLEGILARGDRRLADVIEKAYHKGAIFCGWAEYFNLEPWLEALAECNLDASQFTGARDPEACLPWEHIEAGIDRKFLLRERQKAYDSQQTEDCRFGACQLCGACDTGHHVSRLAREGKAIHRLVFSQRDQEFQTEQPGNSNNRIFQRNDDSAPERKHGPAIGPFRYRFWHRKIGSAAYLSQLELQAAIMRSLRRAKVPVAYSQGFHPLPLLSFGRALPVGVESLAEWFELSLRQPVTPDRLKTMINRYLVPHLTIDKAQPVSCRSIQAKREVFALFLPGYETELCTCFSSFSEKKCHMLARTTKKGEKIQDIRPFLHSWKADMEPVGENRVVFTVDWSNDYISPLLLARAILAPLKMPFDNLKLVKLEQQFNNA